MVPATSGGRSAPGGPGPGPKAATVSEIARPVGLCILAGLREIGGGFLVWRWWREGVSVAGGFAGACALVLYGVVPTHRPAHFGRVYAACSGWFVVLPLLWGWAVGRMPPDRYDLAGAAPCLLGVALSMHAPRG